jgi:hypothetical protein
VTSVSSDGKTYRIGLCSRMPVIASAMPPHKQLRDALLLSHCLLLVRRHRLEERRLGCRSFFLCCLRTLRGLNFIAKDSGSLTVKKKFCGGVLSFAVVEVVGKSSEGKWADAILFWTKSRLTKLNYLYTE